MTISNNVKDTILSLTIIITFILIDGYFCMQGYTPAIIIAVIVGACISLMIVGLSVARLIEIYGE